MALRRGNLRTEFGNKLRIVSVVIHYKAPISLDIFISYLSQIMAIFYFKKSFILIFKNFQSALFFYHIWAYLSLKKVR